jgi:hypothetical protein
MNTGDWIQIGLLLMVMLTLVLLVYSWMTWEPVLSICLTLGLGFLVRLVFRRIQL